MTKLIARRSFMKISATAAVMGAAPGGWAKDIVAPPRPVATGQRSLNDYLVGEISTSALKANLDLVRRELKPETKFCAVVKANCYGHRWSECQSAIVAAADWLAVARPDEAMEVRRSGCRLPTLLLMATGMWGELAGERLRQLISQDITLTAAAPNDLATIAAAAVQVGRPAQIHIKVDTGMTRSGVLAVNAPAFIHEARRQSGVRLTGVYTHYAAADEADKTSAREQFARFKEVIQKCGSDVNGLILHSAASAATIDLPETHLNMVRPGIALYGCQPSDEMQRCLPLKPVLRLIARLTQVKEVPAGSYVGYARTYRFERPAKIGLVPIGYADGYCRSLSNRGIMRVGGRIAPVRGRVSMDQTLIELTGMPKAKVGDEVEIISNDPKAPNSIENLAKLAGTIPHEIMCRLNSRMQTIKTA